MKLIEEIYLRNVDTNVVQRQWHEQISNAVDRKIWEGIAHPLSHTQTPMLNWFREQFDKTTFAKYD